MRPENYADGATVSDPWLFLLIGATLVVVWVLESRRINR